MRASYLIPVAALLAATSLTSAASAAEVFNRVATFPVLRNLPKDADPAKATVSEIISATEDGTLLIYTDSPREALGVVDIKDPKNPKPAGFIQLEGEPTSVKIVGGRAFAAVEHLRIEREAERPSRRHRHRHAEDHLEVRTRRPARLDRGQRRQGLPRHRHRERAR